MEGSGRRVVLRQATGSLARPRGDIGRDARRSVGMWIGMDGRGPGAGMWRRLESWRPAWGRAWARPSARAPALMTFAGCRTQASRGTTPPHGAIAAAPNSSFYLSTTAPARPPSVPLRASCLYLYHPGPLLFFLEPPPAIAPNLPNSIPPSHRIIYH